MTHKKETIEKQEPYSISIMARDFKGMNNHGANIVVEVYELEESDK